MSTNAEMLEKLAKVAAEAQATTEVVRGVLAILCDLIPGREDALMALVKGEAVVMPRELSDDLINHPDHVAGPRAVRRTWDVLSVASPYAQPAREVQGG
ncbi:hypothetical protein EOD42_25550 [Rhodovarius crocodyli]|uniref:Uncharacterized protein n=1 Tax=Rhodovarius crocodyli TaxID=1979269 RepID=A0A437LV77_9PROT|nr:hypothetical protein [Rhodovarius crocodyli]RVT89268.1 hypothetical protein EOD42_25550 [Rhodovarius crocodyli]